MAQGYGTIASANIVEEVKPKPFYRQQPTMDPRSWVKDLTWYFCYILVISTLGPLLFGYHLAELNTPQDVITCKRKTLLSTKPSSATPLPQCIPMTAAELGVVSSIFTLGGLIGALSAGPFSSRYGRLPTMKFTTIFFVIGPVFETLAPSIPIMALGRFISGIGAGSSLVSVPLYISEVSPPAERGFFGAFTQIMTNLGIFVTQLLGYFFSHGQYWRIVLAIAGVIGAVQFIGLFAAVESPKWMAEKGRVSQATRTLMKIRGDKFDVDEEVRSWGAEDQDEEEQAGLLAPSDEMPHTPLTPKSPGNKKEVISFYQVVTLPKYRRAVLAVVLVMLAQQLCGINSIVMYGVNLLADLLKSNSAVLVIGVSAVNIIVTTLCAPLVDKLGRKVCVLSSVTGMGLSSLLLAISIQNKISALSAIAVLTFVASFALGLGPVPFILASELVGPEAVGATQSWALAANWIATFVVAQFFPVVNEWLKGGKVYYVFAGLAAFFGVTISIWVPETMGKNSMEEVWGTEDRRED